MTYHLTNDEEQIDYGFRRLKTAIVLRACEDYLNGLYHHKPDPYYEGLDWNNTVRDECCYNMYTAYEFITSHHLSLYTHLDARTILNRLHDMYNKNEKMPSINFVKNKNLSI